MQSQKGLKRVTKTDANGAKYLGTERDLEYAFSLPLLIPESMCFFLCLFIFWFCFNYEYVAFFVVFRRKLPSQPIVVEQTWPTKRPRVSGSRRKTSQWLEQCGAGTEEAATVEVHTGTVETETVEVHTGTVETVEVHTVETEVQMHTVETVETVEVHTVETATVEVQTVETETVEFHEVIASSPVKKTKMISELVCAEQPKNKKC